jgi:poly-gamma-glutamate synthesis protein (capsule biosynthesis protein)
MRRQFLIGCLLLLTHALVAQAEDVRELKLLFVGDIMGHDSQIAAAEVEKNEVYDYAPCFEYVAPILKSADLAIGNLELTLPGKPPYQGYPLFRSPDDLALDLRYAGFDFLLTANNHSNDGGLNGVVNTINVLDSYGFYHTGTFQNALEREAFYPLIIYKNNFKLAFLNYTYDTNGVPTRAPSIVNEIDEQQIEADMAVARSLQPDAIIVIMHWGEEYQLRESKTQRALAQKLADWGADLIVGAHPHVVQPIKTITSEKTGTTVPIAYSLGNFVSGQVKANTDGGIMLEVTLEKNTQSKKLRVQPPRYIPVWRWRERTGTGKRIYRVIPIAPYEQDATALGMGTTDHAAMLRYAKNLRKHLENSAATERTVSLQ